MCHLELLEQQIIQCRAYKTKRTFPTHTTNLFKLFCSKTQYHEVLEPTNSVNQHDNLECIARALYTYCYQHTAVVSVSKSLACVRINMALYNEAIIGNARSVPHCQHCLSLDRIDFEHPTCSLPMWNLQPSIWTEPTGRSMVGGPSCIMHTYA